jgi:hypothetical protein
VTLQEWGRFIWSYVATVSALWFLNYVIKDMGGNIQDALAGPILLPMAIAGFEYYSLSNDVSENYG